MRFDVHKYDRIADSTVLVLSDAVGKPRYSVSRRDTDTDDVTREYTSLNPYTRILSQATQQKPLLARNNKGHTTE